MEKELYIFLEEVDSIIREDAKGYMKSQIYDAHTMNEMQEIIVNNKIARFRFCNEQDCIEYLDKKIQGELIGIHYEQKVKGKCISCDKDTNNLGFYSKRSDSP